MKKFTSPSQKVGELGEDIACKWLIQKGFSVLDRNYTKKWGEIDIVAQKGESVHFIEVKSSRRVLYKDKPVTHETETGYSPVENMHPSKIKRFIRAVETYLNTSKGQKIKNWQIDLLVVYIDTEKKIARCEIFDKVV